jgi:polysaccharide biosynthesis transport protein
VDLPDYFQVLRRRWISVTIVALATIALTAAVTLAMITKYTATTRLYFSAEASESLTDLAKGMTSYAEVATSPLVLDAVINELNLQTTSTELARTVTVVVPPDTVILEISAVDADPERAAAIANAVGAEVAHVVGDLSHERTDGSKAVQAITLAPALVPTQPSSPNVLLNLLLGVLLGPLFGVGAALLCNMLDTKIRNEHAVRTVTKSPLLGVIRQDDKVPAHPMILRDEPLSATAESVRRLRTNLEFTQLGDRPSSIVITSAIAGEGKSTTAVNLAVALADAGSRVILVDADLHRPSVATCLGMDERVGLTTVLIGRAELRDVVQQWQNSTLDVLPSGPIPPNTSELLGSAAMRRMVNDLTAKYDVVLFDTPPLLSVADAAVLSSFVGGSLLVIGADRVHRRQLRRAIKSLETAGAQLDGVVVNKTARQETAFYSHDADHEPIKGSEVTATAAPKRAWPESEYQRPINGWANQQRERSREATPVPR